MFFSYRWDKSIHSQHDSAASSSSGESLSKSKAMESSPSLERLRAGAPNSEISRDYFSSSFGNVEMRLRDLHGSNVRGSFVPKVFACDRRSC